MDCIGDGDESKFNVAAPAGVDYQGPPSVDLNLKCETIISNMILKFHRSGGNVFGEDMEQENRIREPENKIWQTRLHEQTAFERRLAQAMESAFADGVTELDELVNRLNQNGVRDEQNRDWTIDSFRAVMAELGG
ncbi:MAG: hypothetical protein CMM12_02490 [Rhodospirillaceae bacterium]|nr:hypothetical protein [Rhodospirillaceae bacterium]